MIFGSRHERFVPEQQNPSQLTLDIKNEAPALAVTTKTQNISYTSTLTTVNPAPVNHPGRMKLPEHLRREETIIEPEGDITGCTRIGEEVTEVLEYRAGELFVKRTVRYKYASPRNSGILVGALPIRPLEKAMAGEGLLAQIITDKYIDHLPLHRQAAF